MNYEKLLGQLPVLAPIVHVLTCFIFLFGYSTGFGAGIGALFSFSDLFTISLTDVAYIYISGLLLPLAIVSARFQPGYRTIEHRWANSGTEEDKIKLENRIKANRRLVTVIFSASIITFVPSAYLAIHFDQRIPYSELATPSCLGVTLATLHYLSKFQTSFKVDLIIAAMASLMVGAFLIGVARGQGERRYSTQVFSQNHISCGKYTILRPASGKFIAVDQAGKRIIIKDDCAIAYMVPNRPVFEDVGGLELAKRLFSGF